MQQCQQSANLTSTDCVQPPPASSFMPELVLDIGGPARTAATSAWTARPTSKTRPLLLIATLARLRAGLAVVGTLATETGNATYVGLSANDASIMGGVPNATILDTGLKGSADFYAPGNNPSKFSKFFVHYFTRDCSGTYPAGRRTAPKSQMRCCRRLATRMHWETQPCTG